MLWSEPGSFSSPRWTMKFRSASGVGDRDVPKGAELVDPIRPARSGPLRVQAVGERVAPQVETPAVVVPVGSLVVDGGEALAAASDAKTSPVSGCNQDLRMHRRVVPGRDPSRHGPSPSLVHITGADTSRRTINC